MDLHQHALLLATMLAVGWIVTLLVARLRWHAAQTTAQAQRSDQLRQLGKALRAADAPVDQSAALQRALPQLDGTLPTLLVRGGQDDGGDGGETRLIGPATVDEAAGLRL